jgi:hypothetical protein
MKPDLFTIKFDTDPSPWFNKYVEISFSRSKLQHIVDSLIKECSNKDFDSSYQYDGIVGNVIKENWDNECGSVRPLLQALLKMIYEQTPENAHKDWNNGHVAAARSIRGKIAWSTPGFAEARRYNDIYGG